MKRIILPILCILFTVSCRHGMNNTKHFECFSSTLDTIKVSDSAYVVNAIYYNCNSGVMTAVKICNIINKQ